jgi:hypothetical protein
MYSNLVPPARARSHPPFTKIFKRMKDHHINLDNYIESDLKVYESKLDGISFKTKSKVNPLISSDFLSALRVARTAGRPVFREGKKLDHAHWAIDASMAATKGIGFREITYLNLEDKRRQVRDPGVSMSMRAHRMDPTFSSQFGKSRAQLDISSLHCAVWGNFCSIHIDETGFVLEAMPGMGSDVAMTPDFLQHTLLELIWKDTLKIPDAVEIYVPNSANDFSRMGVRATATLTSRLRLSADVSYNIRGKRGYSRTLVLEGEF